MMPMVKDMATGAIAQEQQALGTFHLFTAAVGLVAELGRRSSRPARPGAGGEVAERATSSEPVICFM